MVTFPATCCVALLLCASFFGQCCWADNAQARKWTDASGKYSVEAGFVDFENGNVRLRKHDGVEITVPFKQLSSSDQKYIRSRLRLRQLEIHKKPSPTKISAAKIPPAAKTAREHGDAKTLYGIQWYPSNAVSSAAAGKSPKPVMWFRVLGSLDGFM